MNNKPETYTVYISSPLQGRGPPKDYLTAKCCPGFLVESNTYYIILMSLMSITTLLKGVPLLSYSYVYCIGLRFVIH